MSAAAVNLLISDAYLLGGIHSVKEPALVVGGVVGIVHVLLNPDHASSTFSGGTSLTKHWSSTYMDLVVE